MRYSGQWYKKSRRNIHNNWYKTSVLVVTSSTQDNAKLLDQLKSGLKKINRNEYLSKISTDIPNQYLDYLINPSFQKVNRLFVLSFENNTQREI